MSEEFKQYATRVLGSLVVGHNDDEWRRFEECWDAAQLAVLTPLLGGKDGETNEHAAI